MVTIRYCSSYPSELSRDDPALGILNFLLKDGLRLPDVRQEFHREDTKEACISRISSNLSDIILNWTSLDVQAPHVKFLPISDQSSPVIISSYEPASFTSDTDVLGVCSLFGYEVLILIVSVVVTVWSFFRCHSFLYRKLKQEIMELRFGDNVTCRKKQETQYSWLILGVIMSHYDSSEMNRARRKSLSFRILFAILLFASFLLHFFFATSIKTNLVTVDRAVIISTLDDALGDKKVQPKWITYDATWKNFADAAPGSVMNKLWNETPENRTFALGLTNALETVLRINKQEIILIGQSVTMNIAYASLCPLSVPFSGTRRMIMKTTHVLQQTAASVYNDRMDQRISKRLHTRALRGEEAGLLQKVQSKFDRPPNLPVDVSPEDIRDCERNRDHEAHAQVPIKTVHDFKSLLIVASIIMVLAIVRLLIDKIESQGRLNKVKGMQL